MLQKGVKVNAAHLHADDLTGGAKHESHHDHVRQVQAVGTTSMEFEALHSRSMPTGPSFATLDSPWSRTVRTCGSMVTSMGCKSGALGVGTRLSVQSPEECIQMCQHVDQRTQLFSYGNIQNVCCQYFKNLFLRNCKVSDGTLVDFKWPSVSATMCVPVPTTATISTTTMMIQFKDLGDNWCEDGAGKLFMRYWASPDEKDCRILCNDQPLCIGYDEGSGGCNLYTTQLVGDGSGVWSKEQLGSRWPHSADDLKLGSSKWAADRQYKCYAKVA